MKSFFLLFFAAVSLATQVAAASPAQEARSVIHLEERSEFYFDADPDLNIDEVSQKAVSPRFAPVAGRKIWVGRNAPAAWLRFAVPTGELGPGYGGAPGSADSGAPVSQWLLIVRPSFSIILDHVDFYVPRTDGSFEEIRAGAKAERRASEPHSRFFVFELPPGAFEGKPCYIRLSSATDVQVEFSLQTSVGFARAESINYIAYGLLYGILAAMTLYSLFLFLSLKDGTYLYYVLYMVSAGLWLFFVQGHAKVFFGQSPGFDQAMLWFWVGSMLTWGAVFTGSFLRLRDGLSVLHRIILVLAGLGAVVSVAGVSGWDDIAFSLSHYLGLVLPALAIAAAVARLVQGFPSSLYFLIAWSFLAVGGFVFSLMGLQVLSVNFWTINSTAIGIAGESILLSMALSDRFKRLQAETRRLEKIQAHYRELSLTDELTGLRNKRFLAMELGGMAAKARDAKTQLSLILLDIDDFKQVNDSFGHGVGDEILVALARTAKNCARETDEICCFGGDEFVVVMPGVPRAEAFDVAERIRNRFAADSLREVGGEELKVTVSLGVVEFDGAETAEALLSRADGAMYEAKRLGKDQSVAR